MERLELSMFMNMNKAFLFAALMLLSFPALAENDISKHSGLIVTTEGPESVRVRADNVVGIGAVDETAYITASGVNGLDAGSEENDTFYNIFAICCDDGTALVLSKSSAPTLPYGYEDYSLVGVVKNNENGSFNEFVQRGVFVNNPQTSVLTAGSSESFEEVDLSRVVPPQATAVMFQQVFWNETGSGNVCVTIAEGGSGTVSDLSSKTTCVPSTENVWNRSVLPFQNILVPQKIVYRVSGNNGRLTLNVAGWRY